MQLLNLLDDKSKVFVVRLSYSRVNISTRVHRNLAKKVSSIFVVSIYGNSVNRS